MNMGTPTHATDDEKDQVKLNQQTPPTPPQAVPPVTPPPPPAPTPPTTGGTPTGATLALANLISGWSWKRKSLRERRQFPFPARKLIFPAKVKKRRVLRRPLQYRRLRLLRSARREKLNRPPPTFRSKVMTEAAPTNSQPRKPPKSRFQPH